MEGALMKEPIQPCKNAQLQLKVVLQKSHRTRSKICKVLRGKTFIEMKPCEEKGGLTTEHCFVLDFRSRWVHLQQPVVLLSTELQLHL